ncbi:hypothetical protein QYE76_007056 [Lolium multiflorum]|uniref:C2H2-type domain-containing protein n=1 Tax=Lolium multiflorum TaxID=4521 RepID=A0AAD8RZF6_LOLMU|nr:uncharacterized protein LOC127304410 [Lolium perenne]KAK1632741.1 hypothetical protein QYE76_007056 [Lolium multiflorum]
MESTAAHHDGVISLDLRLRLQTPSLPTGDIDRPTAIAIAIARDEASFACDYCDRRFFSRKALGGHQNAHRLGRAFARRDAAATPALAPPVLAHWLHARREQLWRAYLASAAVNWAWPTSEHNDGEAAAAPELDLSLKL